MLPACPTRLTRMPVIAALALLMPVEPPKIEWGKPVNDVCLGLEVAAALNRPPTLRVYAKCLVDDTRLLCLGDFRSGKVVPTFTFRDPDPKLYSGFRVTPPRGVDGLIGVGSDPPIVVNFDRANPHLVYEGRFWIPGRPGEFDLEAHLTPATHLMAGAPGSRQLVERTLTSGKVRLTLRESDCVRDQSPP